MSVWASDNYQLMEGLALLKAELWFDIFRFFFQFPQNFIAFWPDLECCRGSYDALKSFCIKKGRQDRQQSRTSQALTGSASKWEWLWRSVCPQHSSVGFWLPQGYGAGQGLAAERRKCCSRIVAFERWGRE